MAEYTFVVAADRAYLPALNALLNSLEYIGWKSEYGKCTKDLHLIMYKDFPKEYQERLGEFSFNILEHPFSKEIEDILGENKKADYGKRYRYKVASEVVENYDAVCFVDSDLFFVKPVDMFFEIAKNGILLGAAKSGKTRYGNNPSYHVNGKELLPKPIWNTKDICCCPIFFNKKYKQVFADVWWGYTAEKRFEASDLFAINTMILKNGADKRMLTLPCHSFVGTNEVMLKPFTRVVEKEGGLISENGDIVYSVHGKWFSEGWHNGQKLHMDRLIDKYMGDKKAHWTGNYMKALNDIMKWHVKMQHVVISIWDFEKYVDHKHLKFMKRWK